MGILHWVFSGDPFVNEHGNGKKTTKVADKLRPAHWPAAAPDKLDNAK
jgi:hypothetical protein